MRKYADYYYTVKKEGESFTWTIWSSWKKDREKLETYEGDIPLESKEEAIQSCIEHIQDHYL